MNALDSFALGGRQDDAELLALFRQWCAAWRATRSTGPNEELDAAVNEAGRIAEQIYNAPVQGVVGLAIKAFMVGEGSMGDDLDASPRREDVCALGPFVDQCYSRRHLGNDQWTDVAHLFQPQRALRGLLASAAGFVPELLPL